MLNGLREDVLGDSVSVYAYGYWFHNMLKNIRLNSSDLEDVHESIIKKELLKILEWMWRLFNGLF